MTRARLFTAALVSLASACTASTAQRKPWDRGPRASDHLTAAREQSQIAAQEKSWPDTRGNATGQPDAHPPVPWYYYWNTAEDHERLAQEHMAAADQILAEYEVACRDMPSSEIVVSPIQRWVIGGGAAPDGAMFVLDGEAGTPERVMAEMRCHRAWMMLGRTQMDDCPLDVADIDVVAHAVDGAIEVLVTTRDAKAVPELQRRAAKEIESGSAARLHQTVTAPR